MTEEKPSKEDEKSLKVIIITAAVTALVTGFISNLIPSIVTRAYNWWKQDPILIVEVHDDERKPVTGAKIAASLSTTDVVLDYGTTDETGAVKLRKIVTGTLALEALLEEGPYIRKYRKFHKIESFPHVITLDRSKDFFQVPTNVSLNSNVQTTPSATSSPSATSATPDLSPSPAITPSRTLTPQDALRIQYGKTLLSIDRKVRARLEIDWVEGTHVPELKAQTSAGVITIEELFKDVGIDLEVVRNDNLPGNVLGPDRRLSLEESRRIAANYRNAIHPEKWHFYLIVAARSTVSTTSFMFDTEGRTGAVVLTESGTDLGVADSKYVDPRFIFFQVVHEVGHMLNLPHPWQAYGDTKSVMTSPHRWSDWSWDDPQVYRFDQFGQTHIRRAPDQYAMPGGSAFLDYGAPVKWVKSA